jgi:hypothetical protein
VTMKDKDILWKTLAAELDEGLRLDLGGEGGAEPAQAMRTRGGVTGPRAVRTRGAVRVRGAAPTRGAARRPEPAPPARRPTPVVAVEVPVGREAPTAQHVRRLLTLAGNLDVYHVVPKHWAALQPRELNPDDRDRGREHYLILKNLALDFALVVSAEHPPAWSRSARKVVAW